MGEVQGKDGMSKGPEVTKIGVQQEQKYSPHSAGTVPVGQKQAGGDGFPAQVFWLQGWPS